MERTIKLNSIGESMENCRSAFSLVCEGLEVTDDELGRPVVTTKDDPSTIDATDPSKVDATDPEKLSKTEEDEKLAPEAEKMIEKDSAHLGSFMGNIDQDTQYVHKNGLIVTGDSTTGGLLGQANLIATVKKLVDAGVTTDDFGILSAGGAFGKVYYLWYNPKCVKAANIIADIDKKLEDYPVVDEDLYSNLESLMADDYWKNVMDNDDKIEYYRDHGVEVDPAWESGEFEGEIEKPDCFDENGDITDKIQNAYMSDADLKDCGLDIPKEYFV